MMFLLRHGRFHREIEEEMGEHLRLKAETLHKEGMPPADARYAAQREFSNALLLGERCRDAWGVAWVEVLMQDLRYGLRQLLRAPGFTGGA